jgi:CRP-like cAMP-binding protein
VLDRSRVTRVTLLPVAGRSVLGGELFRGLPQEEVKRLVAVGRRRRFARNEIVFHQGDPADTLHLVLRGHFVARLDSELGATITASVHGPGDAFGELALLDLEEKRSTTVAALEAGETHAVHRDDFTRLRAQHPSVNDVLARLLAERVRRMGELLAEAFAVDAERRLLRRLVELAALYGNGLPGTVVPLSQSELAGLAGTSRATVNRVLRAEAARGTLELRRGQTRILEPATLARRAGRLGRS